tara:strand:+ start:159 stop:380 length:222 start_codon:yes stop_codon:yes gene_type:complete
MALKMHAHLIGIKTKLEGEKAIHLADLDTYLHKQVAIGEHPDIGHEIQEKIKLIGEIDDQIDTISRYFGDVDL